jgi:hypothetical protein
MSPCSVENVSRVPSATVGDDAARAEGCEAWRQARHDWDSHSSAVPRIRGDLVR